MAKNHLITALDFGSETIKMAVAQKRREGKLLEILAFAKGPSSAIRRGVIVNPEKTGERVKELLAQIEATVNKKIKEIVCNVGGSHLFVTSSRGVVAVSRADQQISQEDIERVLSAAQAFSLPSNKEILDTIPKEFIVDGEKEIKDPLGMKGVRLEVEILAICGFSPYLKNLTSTLNLGGLNIVDIVPSALASGRAVLDHRQRELGVAVLDIGAWTTDMAVFEEGELIHLAVFPIGSGHITNDIAIGLQTDIDIAEKIKIKFGDCIYQRKGKPEKLEISLEKKEEDRQLISEKEKKEEASLKESTKESRSLIFSRKVLIDIIEARVSEIFDLCQKELKKIGKEKLLPAGIVLTGGTAKLPNIENLAKKELKLPCQIGFPKGVVGVKKDPTLSTLCGLLLQNFDLEEEIFSSKPGFLSRLKRLFRMFVP